MTASTSPSRCGTGRRTTAPTGRSRCSATRRWEPKPATDPLWHNGWPIPLPWSPAMVDRSSINPDAKALEDAFFARENAKLLEQIRAKTERTQRREALRAAMGNVEDTTVDRLLEIGVSAESVLALMLVPLVRVAWA